MLSIQRIDRKNIQNIIARLKVDPITHMFAVYDLMNDPQHTIAYAAFENDDLKGYILTYTGTDIPSVIFECEENVADRLIERAPTHGCIIHASPNLQRTIKKHFPEAKHYIEDWMLIKKNEAVYFKSELVRQLQSEEDASKLSDLLLSRKDRSQDALEKYAKWIRKMPLYGVFKNDQVFSCAASFIRLPEVWFIGGVYTCPEQRGKGYATLATSAITEEALKKADAATLFVRSDNIPAKRVYEKIGYRKIDEKLWVDAGTGLKP